MIFGEHPLKDAYRRALWGPGRRALLRLPPPLELYGISGGARVAAQLLSGKRARILENLRRAFPDERDEVLDRIAREAFAAHFANQYLSFSFSKCDAKTWPRYLEMRGLERLQAAWSAGHGVVLAHAHLGPAQLPLHVLGVLGWRMHQIGGGRVTAVPLSETGRWAAETRRSLEAAMPVTVHDGKRFLRPVLRALGRGELVMSACDATGGGEELGRRRVHTVLGQPMPVPVGPAWLAYTTGAPLLTVACHHNEGRGAPYVAEFGPEIPLLRDQGKEAALESGTRGLAAWLDTTLRRWPGDWLFWDGFVPGVLLAESP